MNFLKQRFIVAFLLLGFMPFTQAAEADGLMTLKSQSSVQQTMDKFEQAALAKGLKVFARVDHSAGAKKIGQVLRPNQLLIFGNPQGGTPLMKCQQTFGIDLPLKVLVWRDENQNVWLAYNDVDYLTDRHKVERNCGSAKKLKQVLSEMAEQATR